MRYLTALCLFVLLGGHSTEAQVLPTSSGSCGISASGAMGCNWMSGIDLRRKTDGGKTADNAADERSKLFVTRCVLAPGAPLNPLVEGHDVLIVGMNKGELVNEKKSPQSHVNISNGSVMLMPKEEPYLLRNIGKENLELLLIDVRK
jgi:mannose-6-phosphate isomerase-like protein (cupin superfamily)